MKSNKNLLKIIVIIIFILCCYNCGGSSRKSSSTPTSGLTNGATLASISGANVIPITINGSKCSADSYFNKPCATVTICAPGSTTNCDTIDDILVDTGSSGLRIFSSALNNTVEAALTDIVVGTKDLAECIQYGDGSSNWGPVKKARVVLGETAVSEISIQIIDSTFRSAYKPSGCSDPDTDPDDGGYTGILGVGLFRYDCGEICVTTANNGVYYACNASSCTATTATLEQQTANPVGQFSTNNNGIIFRLPTVAATGAASISGYLVLGIGTETNNAVISSLRTFSTDSYGEFVTTFNSQTYSGFVDTGSNALYFESPSNATLPMCESEYLSSFFCPETTQSLSARNTASSSTTTSLVNFEIGNFYNLLIDNMSSNVFSNVGGGALSGTNTTYFIWGLPFHIGRNVYVGLEGASSSLGEGTYWAF